MGRDAWFQNQASLPIRHGGIGVRKISSVALPAFLSSIHSTSALVTKLLRQITAPLEVACLAEASEAWKMAFPIPGNFPLTPNSQRSWDKIQCEYTVKNLLDNSTDADHARLVAASARESGHWLHAYPCANVGTLLDSETLRVAIGLRVGAQVCIPHTCSCGSVVDALGHHGLSCVKSAGRLSRHASINDIIRRSLVTINVPAVLEPNGIARDDGKRPDGMSLIPWKMGRALVWDATCVDTLAPSHLPRTTRSAGSAAEAAEKLKVTKYRSLLGSYYFVAFGLETLGPWGPGAKALFAEIAKRLANTTGDPKSGSYLAQRISIAIQRGNAASILGTLPQGPSLY